MKAQSSEKSTKTAFLVVLLFILFCIPNAKSQIIVMDSSFEAGHPNTYWQEYSAVFTHVICNYTCGTCGGNCIPRSGNYFVWLGGSSIMTENSFVQQEIYIPETHLAALVFYLKIPHFAANQVDYFSVVVDTNVVFKVVSEDSSLYKNTYVRLSIDISKFADGGNHLLTFKCFQNANPSKSSFLIDDVSIISGVGIKQYEQKISPFEIYPNPAVDNIHIVFRSDISEKSTLKIYNSLGILVKTYSDFISTSIKLSVEDLPTGTYFICLSDADNGEQSVKKISIK